MFTRAIVRKPGKSLVHGLTSASLGRPDYTLAFKQHEAYVQALISCGLEVTVLPADEAYPDSVFVEDTALLTRECAIVTLPGVISRRGEVSAMEKVLTNFCENIERIETPGTVEAGDIMMVGDEFYIGLSDRTNQSGADQIIASLEKYGYRGQTAPVGDMLHFKSGIAYLEEDTFIAVETRMDLTRFMKSRIIKVPVAESYAANCVWVNGTVLVAKGFPQTLERIQSAGYPTIVLDMSEFQKLDGGLSCLSLRF